MKLRPTTFILAVLLLLLAATLTYAQPVRPNYKTLTNLPVVDVTAAPYNAKGDGVTNDAAAIQAAVDAAALQGGNIYKGGVVYFPRGTYLINSSIVLPESGDDRTPIVHMVGDNPRTSMLVGGASFPANRGLVEWDPGVSAAWGGRIAHLGFRTPYGVAGVRCIYHKASKAGGLQAVGTTLADVMAEWFQCDFEDLYLEGDNMDNEVLIDLEVGNRYCKLKNIVADPWRGIPPAGQQPTYSTMLLRVAHQYAGADPPMGEDSVGLFAADIEGLQPLVLQGGWVRTFQGRVGLCKWDTSFTNGPLPGGTGVGYAFLNSFATSLNNLSSEGGGGRCQYLFSNCRTIIGHNLGVAVGAPSQVSPWAASTVYALGARVVPVALYNANTPAPTNRVYTVTTAGTSGATEPAWADTGTTASGTATFTASTGWGAADGIILENCEGCHFDTHHIDPSSPPASYRLTKHISIDAASRNNSFEQWSIRGVTSGPETVNTDVLPEVTIQGTANSISGRLLQASGNYSIPFAVGLDPNRLEGVATSRGDENLLLSPAAFDTGDWIRGNILSVGANVAIDPFGIQRADKVTPATSNTVHSLNQSYTRGAVQKQQTFSVYLKGAGYNNAVLYLSDNVGFLMLDCNLQTGAAAASVLVPEAGMTLDGSGATNVGNGWWRFRITGTLPAATTVSRVYVFPSSIGAYAGDGTSGILAYGAQLENSAAATTFRDPNPTLIVGVDAPVQRFDVPLTANRTVTLSTAGAYNGSFFDIARTGGGAFTLDVGGLKTIPASTSATVRVRYDGTAWRLASYAADNDAALANRVVVGTTYSLGGGLLTGFGTAAGLNTGTTNGTIPLIGSGDKLSASIIPAIPATDVYVVASQAAMLALTGADTGDIAKRTDLGSSFILTDDDETVLANWVTLTDAAAVTSVNGLSGAVTLTTGNVTESGNLYYTTGRVNTDAPNVTLSAGADALLSLTPGQQIGIDNATAHYVLVGPTAGGAAAPTMRLLESTDLPAHTHTEADVTNLVTDLAGKSDVTHLHDDRYYTETETGTLFPNVTLTAAADAILNLTGQALTVDTQTANTFLAGPTAGGAAAPAFRLMVAADVPTLAQSKITNLTTDLAALTPMARTITTTAPLTGGGDLTANRTLGINAATETTTGAVELATNAETVTGTDTARATTPAGVAAAIAAAPGGATILTMRQTADVTVATTTPTAATGMVFTYAANSFYRIEWTVFCTSVAATTGYAFTLDTSTAPGTGGVHLQFEHGLAATGTLTGGYSVGDNGATVIGVSSGVPVAGQEIPVTISAQFHSGGTGGTAQLMFRPEVAASATIKAGSVGQATLIP